MSAAKELPCRSATASHAEDAEDGCTRTERRCSSTRRSFASCRSRSARSAVAANGDLFADILVGAGAGGGPVVSVPDGRTLATIQSFDAYAPALAGTAPGHGRCRLRDLRLLAAEGLPLAYLGRSNHLTERGMAAKKGAAKKSTSKSASKSTTKSAGTSATKGAGESAAKPTTPGTERASTPERSAKELSGAALRREMASPTIASVTTMVCLTCGAEQFFDDAVPANLKCQRCGSGVFRTFDTPTERNEATVAHLEEEARSVQYGDPSPQGTVEDARDLDMGPR